LLASYLGSCTSTGIGSGAFLGFDTSAGTLADVLGLAICVMDIGYFSYFLSPYLLDKETQHDTYLNPCSEFTLNFLDSIYSQMTPFHERSFLLEL
jgi:hypothetical protein